MYPLYDLVCSHLPLEQHISWLGLHAHLHHIGSSLLFIQNKKVPGFFLSVPPTRRFTLGDSPTAVFYSLRSVLFHPTTDHSMLFNCGLDIHVNSSFHSFRGIGGLIRTLWFLIYRWNGCLSSPPASKYTFFRTPSTSCGSGRGASRQSPLFGDWLYPHFGLKKSVRTF